MKENYFPFMLYRKSALPITVLDSFGSRDLELQIERYFKNQCSLVEEVDDLVTVLEVKIGEDIENELRKKLINIKRKIFNFKAIAHILEENNKQLDQLNVLDLLVDYQKKLDQLNVLQQKIEQKYREILLYERENIQKTIQQQGRDIRKAFKFIHGTIDEKLEKYLRTNIQEHDRKLRKLDITLLKIITRAAAKTSPFSSLAYSGFDCLSTNTTQKFNSIKQKKRQTVTKINETFLYRVYDKILKFPEIYQTLVFQIAPAISLDENKVYWTALVDDEKSLVKTYKMRDRLVTLPRTKLMNQILEKFANNSFSYQEFKEELGKQKHDEQELQTIFENLYEKDFIIPLIALPQNSQDLLGDCIKGLKKFQFDYLQPVITILENLEEIFIGYDNLAYQEQYEAQATVNKGITEVCNYLDLVMFDTKYSTYQDALEVEIGQRLDFENSEYSAKLSKLMKFYNLFNSSYLIKRKIAERFLAKYGTRKVEMSEEWEESIRTILDANLTNTHLWQNQSKISNEEFIDTELTGIQNLKNQFLSYLISNIDSEKIELNDSVIDPVIDKLPNKLLKERQSNSFFIQKNQNQLVLNHFYEGTLKYFTRFLKQFPDVTNTNLFQNYVKDAIQKYNFVDVNATYGFNANNRVHLMNKEIQLLNTPPIGRTMEETVEEILDFKKLSIQYNEESKLLDVYDSNEKVKVAFLGSLMPMMLPGVVSSLSVLSIDSAMYLDFSAMFSALAIDNKKDTAIIKLPEVTFEQNIILSRKKWILNLSQLEELKNNVKNDHLHQIGQFLKYHDLPLQCFISGLDPNFETIGANKPQYMDFTSPSLIKLFAQIMSANDYIVLEEINPIINTENYPDEQVEELIIEITREQG